ncbi:GNAT family N-acetyltransferase [Halomonas denitrificans]|nr:GNAT family N-acetyltransferase [Halomonas denitrificans]
MSEVLVRPASGADFEAIRTIYAEAVSNSASSFELEPPSVEEMRTRHRRLVDAGYPYLVAVLDDQLAGYCYAGPFRDRPAYRRTVESSVYVSSAFRRRGVARLLMERLIEECATRGFRQMIAVIGGKRNAASIALHEVLGFAHVGVLRDVGRKFGAWQDVTLMQRLL